MGKTRQRRQKYMPAPLSWQPLSWQMSLTPAAVPPSKAEQEYNHAVELEKRGKPDEAIAHYRRALSIKPDLADAHNNLGNLLKNQGKLDEAIACYRRAIASDAAYQMAYYNLGNVYQVQGRLKEAVDSYHRALEINPSDADSQNNLGNTLKALGRTDDAIVSYRLAIAINPNHLHGHLNLGNVLLDQKKYKEAAGCYQRHLSITPGDARAYYQLGRAQQRQRKFKKAAACFQRATELDPKNVLAHFELANTLRQLGMLDEAIDAFERTIAIKPNFAQAHNNLGNALKEKDHEKLDRALPCYARALEIDPKCAEARINYAKAHKFRHGDPELEELKALLTKKGLSDDNRNQLLFVLAKAYDEIGDYSQAFSYFSRANEDMAARVSFDAAIHREAMKEIVEAFQRPPSTFIQATSPSGGVPIFVLGMSRSGKTLVETLLTQHPDVYGAGESQGYINATKKVLDEKSISERFPKCMDSLGPDEIAKIGDEYMKEISKDSPSSRFFVNTLPGNFRYVPLIFLSLPQARVIYCRRNPLDHCLFVYFKRYSDGNTHSYDLRNVAAYYADYRDLLAHWQELYGPRICTVVYEEFVRRPVDMARRLYESCGLDNALAETHLKLTADEIGHWERYEPYLGSLRDALGQ